MRLQKGDTEGLVNYGLSIKGVKLTAIFIENKEEEIIKISLRSKGNIDVNQIAKSILMEVVTKMLQVVKVMIL